MLTLATVAVGTAALLKSFGSDSVEPLPGVGVEQMSLFDDRQNPYRVAGASGKTRPLRNKHIAVTEPGSDMRLAACRFNDEHLALATDHGSGALRGL